MNLISGQDLLGFKIFGNKTHFNFSSLTIYSGGSNRRLLGTGCLNMGTRPQYTYLHFIGIKKNLEMFT